jgi:glutamyl-tRNA synthetase
MAPSPTGEFHIGGMRTLLYNYAFAKKIGGTFVLRIEDTDRERLVEGAVDRLIDVIKDYGLSWDEGPKVGGAFAPYVQSQRLSIYKEHALKLVETGHAYYCFCSKERLETLKEEEQKKGVASTRYDKKCANLSKEEVADNLSKNTPYVIRLKVNPGEIVSFTDTTLGPISFPTNDIDDQVLLKSDGFPTYHLAVVVDDHLMKITHVLRGVEWLPSTPKHILLYQAFGWDLPIYAHLPLLKEKGDTKKLSKRMGSVSAIEFLSEGYLPEALLNFLMFLGWNPGTEKEIYSLAEFIQDFSLDRIHKTDLVVFDRDKLLWINGHYIRALSTKELFLKLKAYALTFSYDLNSSGDEAKDLAILSLTQERLKTLKEYNQLTDFFYHEVNVDKESLVKQSGSVDKTKAILGLFLDMFEGIDESGWHKDLLDQQSHKLLEDNDLKPKEAFMTIRVAVSGTTTTPPLFDVLYVLGKNQILRRVKVAYEML